jgi:hypothetical protein
MLKKVDSLENLFTDKGYCFDYKYGNDDDWALWNYEVMSIKGYSQDKRHNNGSFLTLRCVSANDGDLSIIYLKDGNSAPKKAHYNTTKSLTHGIKHFYKVSSSFACQHYPNVPE